MPQPRTCSSKTHSRAGDSTTDSASSCTACARTRHARDISLAHDSLQREYVCVCVGNATLRYCVVGSSSAVRAWTYAHLLLCHGLVSSFLPSAVVSGGFRRIHRTCILVAWSAKARELRVHVAHIPFLAVLMARALWSGVLKSGDCVSVFNLCMIAVHT